MSNKTYTWISVVSFIGIIVWAAWFWGVFEQQSSVTLQEENELSAVEMKKARTEYFFNLLKDPATNRIPEDIRSRELEYSRKLPSRGARRLQKSGETTQQSEDLSWKAAGPNDLGGRTRALGIDQPNSNYILAGGVSGGIWKSTDGGSSWELKTNPNQNMSVTSLAQDPTNPDTWYYSTGEYRGRSASDRGSTAFYYGTGIYKSIDNGDSWSLLSTTKDQDTSFDSRYDFISRVKVSPTTGSLFAASNAFGLLRSTDGGSSFSVVKGGQDDHVWTDFDIDSKGNIIGVFSSESFDADGDPGIFYSTDEGDSWKEVTPTDFPSDHDRSVITFAPSDPSIVYVFTRKVNSSTNQGVSFFKIDVSDPENPTADDRSANLPDFGDPVGGVNTQFNYNMVVSVKPDDPDFVLVGATNLFRSRNGFATKPSEGYDNTNSSQKNEYWIGGYAKVNNVSQYSEQHPDQHVIAYDPDDPNRVWAGHDGGLSVSEDITATSVAWSDKDDSYVTGQFYSVAIPSTHGDDRIMGGTQDNGTPFYRFDGSQQQTSILDVSSGDGSYAFWGSQYAYVSSQNGKVLRITIEDDGDITSPYDGATSTEWSSVYPSGAVNQLFVHPYEIDPNDDGVMYYPGGTVMWRNNQVDQIDNFNQGGASESQGWESFSGANGTITALEVTDSQPSDRLYYAAFLDGSPPEIFSLDNAATVSSPSPTDISIPSSAVPTGETLNGAYVHDIAVNPNDGNELLVVMSNYNIVGLYHSTDGGSSWKAVEGNLTGDTNPGPSLRSATILPIESGTLYLVGTSTGVYSTTSLSGSSTSWAQESDGGSPSSIGYSVAEYIVSRPTDGTIAVGTHGRGIFLGEAGSTQPRVNFTLDITNNWQLVGSPMALKSEVQLGDDLTIFGFSGTYKSSSSIESQTGYWVKSGGGSQITFDGDPYTSTTIALEEGWNIMGGITDTVDATNISDPNGILSSTPVQEYVNGSYQEATDIKSGHGYWIHADQAGDIELSTSSSSSKERMAGTIPSVDRMTFSSGPAEQRFFVAGKDVDGNTKDRFRMPPQAPEPLLDVRTSDGFRLVQDESTELKLTASSFPVSVSLPQQASSNYLLKGVTGQDTVYYELHAGNDAEIQQSHQKYFLESLSDAGQITQHNLFPNYPNPFNPTTRVRYQVASQANVSIEVYNVLGQKVRTLVNREQTTGSYTVQFDGRNLSSGTYFIHLKAGNTAKVQKMTLIK